MSPTARYIVTYMQRFGARLTTGSDVRVKSLGLDPHKSEFKLITLFWFTLQHRNSYSGMEIALLLGKVRHLQNMAMFICSCFTTLGRLVTLT